MRNLVRFGLLCGLLFLASAGRVSAYYTNMPADVVVGQPNFTYNQANQGNGSTSPTANSLRAPMGLHYDGQRFFIADGNNARVLIYNSIPTSNNAAADVVVGQPNFTTNTSGTNATTLNSGARNVWSDGQKLFIVDQINSRVLIYNSIPTTNGAAADVVIGQSSMNVGTANQGGSAAANTLNNPRDIAVCNGKVVISDSPNNRVLIYNSIPTSNNASADVVVGQTTFSGVGTGTTASTVSSPRAFCDGQKLFVIDTSNHRVLIYNSIPTSNGATADVVIGQTNFTTGTSGTAANKFNTPVYAYSDGQRLFITDNGNNRIVVFNSIPTTNGAYADLVLGQSSFTTGSANQGGSTNSNTLFGPVDLYVANNKLFIADSTNNRVLVYDNIVKTPGITLDSSVEQRDEHTLRMRGTAKVDSPYLVSSTQYSVNGGNFSSAVPTDGGWNSSTEDFYVDFDPQSNQPKDAQGNLLNGYTIRFKSVSNNADYTDHAFFFTPFVLNEPAEAAVMRTSLPTFDFSVNKQRLALAENLDHYAIQVRNRANNAGWQTIIENIPVDFASHKGDLQNLQRSTWENISTLDGEYETNDFLAKYSDDGSRIAVHSKSGKMSGAYEWKVLAVDKAGRTQETGARNIVVTGDAGSVTPGFPLAILNISGLGNPNISSYNLAGIKSSYRTSSTTPVFYGIAWSGSTIKLQLTQQNCTINCVQEFSTTANALSRFGLNVPSGLLKKTGSYSVRMSAQFDSLYTELPTFTLKIN